MLYFEKAATSFSQDNIMQKDLFCLQTMDIPLGDQIGESIAILCHSPRTASVWSGMVKLHLKNPEQDGLKLLHGTSIFTILLDDDAPTIAKVAKSYDSLASSSLLFVKISSETIEDLDAHQLLKEVMDDSFQRGLEFKLSQVQKTAGKSYGWLVTTSSKRTARIQKRPHYHQE